MGYHPIEELLPQAGNSVYRLVRMAANRALEISEGKPKLVPQTSSEKSTTVALEEILHKKIIYKDAEETLSKSKKKSPSQSSKE